MLDSFPMIKRNNFEKTFQQRYEAACIAAENLMDKFA
jgi:hypothetical protein